jgi:plastocyanin
VLSALLAVAFAIPAAALVEAEDPPSVNVRFGLPGHPADPQMAAGGTTRDVNDPSYVVVKRGATVNFLNRSGGMHQVAVYDKGLNFDQPGCGGEGNACANLTTLTDIKVPPTTPKWGPFISPPDGSPAVDDPATQFNESSLGAGLLAMGPSPLGVAGPARIAGAIDFSYKFQYAGQYLVLCNFTPHFVSYAQVTWVLVTD